MTHALPARPSAARALDRIIHDGAYSNVIVARTLTDPPSDHGHFQALVYTALRYLPWIDAVVERHTSRPIDRIDRRVLAVLRIAVGEYGFLDTEPHAVVNEAVRSVRALRRDRAGGFVNAVLRSIVGAEHDVVDAIAAAYPEVVRSIVSDSRGEDWADAFLVASNEAPALGIRYRDGSHGDAHIPGAAYLDDDAMASVDRRGEQRGDSVVDGVSVDVIDPASTAVTVAVGAQPGDLVADLAAAPGGKALALIDAVGTGGRVVAVDIHARRLSDAARRVTRSWREPTDAPVSWLVADAANPPFRSGVFDRVLLDAPCTGLGTMRRRPEIRYRIDRAAPGRYGRLQRSMVEAALRIVRPGGRLVYSVCTVTTPETTDVVADLGFRPPEGLMGEIVGDGLLLSPGVTGTDGMFIAVADR